MKRASFHAATNRSGNIFHIETDGAVVNIYVGIVNNEGNPVTRVDVLPDDETRGGDENGRIWDINPDDGNGVTRVVGRDNAR